MAFRVKYEYRAGCYSVYLGSHSLSSFIDIPVRKIKTSIPADIQHNSRFASPLVSPPADSLVLGNRPALTMLSTQLVS